MRFPVIPLLLLGLQLGFGCESDCLQCHPKLQPLEENRSNPLYRYHNFLKSCTKCHPNHKSGKVEECGADCFQCHSREKLVKTPVIEHQKLKSCTQCHAPAPTDLLQPKGGTGTLPF
jgi:hypothetical protein